MFLMDTFSQIVEGAVSMVQMALDSLSRRAHRRAVALRFEGPRARADKADSA